MSTAAHAYERQARASMVLPAPGAPTSSVWCPPPRSGEGARGVRSAAARNGKAHRGLV